MAEAVDIHSFIRYLQVFLWLPEKDSNLRLLIQSQTQGGSFGQEVGGCDPRVELEPVELRHHFRHRVATTVWFSDTSYAATPADGSPTATSRGRRRRSETALWSREVYR